MEPLLVGRRIEDRELEPTATGHPRSERKDEVEAIRRRRNGSSVESQRSNFELRLRPTGEDDIDGASKVLKGFDCS